MNYKELVEKTKAVGDSLIEDNAPKCANICYEAAWEIEDLIIELNAIKMLAQGICIFCKHNSMCGLEPCKTCLDSDKWEWRGKKRY